jgi:S1-C subfamily serine protease
MVICLHRDDLVRLGIAGPLCRVEWFASMTLSLLVAISPTLAQEGGIPGVVVRVARDATVRIDTPGSPGTGVVIRNSEGSCQILTVYHVSTQLSRAEGGEVWFRNGRRLPFAQSNTSRVGATDLASISLAERCPVHHVASLGNPNDLMIGDQIFVSGFSANLSPEVDTASFRITAGRIVSQTEQPDGYSLTYDAATMPGMSGGGVFSAKGFLMGIHGRGETLGQSGVKVAAMGLPVKLLNGSNAPAPSEYRAPWSFPGGASKPCPGVVC